jgi:hypothetical protein
MDNTKKQHQGKTHQRATSRDNIKGQHQGAARKGHSLDAHEDEHCPGSSSDPTAADARLLESLLGRRRLSLMERMGRIPFMRNCE